MAEKTSSLSFCIMKIEEISEKHAYQCHYLLNHKYDGDKNYSFHLDMVRDISEFFKQYIPQIENVH